MQRLYHTGERHHRAKYSNALVEQARQMHDQGVSGPKIAKTINVPYFTVRDWIVYHTRAFG